MRMRQARATLDCSVSGGFREVEVDPTPLAQRERELLGLAAFLQGFAETLDALEEELAADRGR